MSYGWAILVIMAVGGVMWQLGIFNVGGSVPPTTSGFQTLKPLIQTCEMRNDVWNAGYNGFTCQFVNAAGGEIRLRDINVTVDGEYCTLPLLDRVPILDFTKSFILYYSCPTVAACMGPWSIDLTTWHSCPPWDSPDCFIPVPDGGQFTVYAFTWANSRDDPCADIIDGKSYTVDVAVTYEINVGGIVATKVSSGKVRLPGKE